MRESVKAIWFRFSTGFEGAVPWMYQDIYTWVTTAIGNLIDVPGQKLTAAPFSALSLPWVKKSDMTTRATREEINAEWLMVKNDPNAAMAGHRSVEKKTQLRLTEEGLAQCVLARMALNDIILEQRFPEINEWPADAQIATASMAWACGANFNFPRLAKALAAWDFETAAKECHMDTRGPDKIEGTKDDNRGLIPRNTANKALYRAAAAVFKFDLDYDVVHWTKHDQVIIPVNKPALNVDPNLKEETVEVGIHRDWDIVHPQLDLGPSPTDREV